MIKFNDPRSPHLPPVGCPLIIKIGDTEQKAERTGYIAKRGDMMEYKLASTGELVIGLFWWRYT